MVVSFANLNKLDFPYEVIDDLLKSLMAPPFNGEVHLSASDNDPEGSVFLSYFLNLRHPGLLVRA